MPGTGQDKNTALSNFIYSVDPASQDKKTRGLCFGTWGFFSEEPVGLRVNQKSPVPDKDQYTTCYARSMMREATARIIPEIPSGVGRSR